MDGATNTPVSSLRVDATIHGYRHLLRWASQFGERRWADDNARGLGCHLAQWLVAQDEVMLDASTAATARVRELSRGGRRKNDVIDAAAAASVAALQGDASLVVCRGHDGGVRSATGERRANLAAQRVRSVNQIHALLRDLIPGGAPTALKANTAGTLLRKVRPKTPTARTRKALAWDLVREIRSIDTRLERISAKMTKAFDDYPSRLLEVDGIGPLLAVRQLCRRCTRRGLLRRAGRPPAVTKRRPEAELGAASGRCHPGPDAQQRRTPVLRPQDQRGQDPQSSNEMPQTQDRISCLAVHAHRRTLPTQRQQTPSKGGLTNTHTGRGPLAGGGSDPLTNWPLCLFYDLSACFPAKGNPWPGERGDLIRSLRVLHREYSVRRSARFRGIGF